MLGNLILLWLTVSLLGESPALATIFDVDDRVPARSIRIMDAVGIVTGGTGVVYGSGFLIDPCTVLSARHVGGSDGVVVGKVLQFRTAGLSSAGKVMAAGQYFAGPSELRPIGADWMLVRLNKCLGRKAGFFHLSATSGAFPIRGGLAAVDAGFPRDHSLRAGPTIDPNCRILWVGGGRIAHDCATLAGNSGGPILALTNEGWVAVGINAAGNDRATIQPFAAAKANFAVDVGSILPVICSLIDEAYRPSTCGHSE